MITWDKYNQWKEDNGIFLWRLLQIIRLISSENQSGVYPSYLPREAVRWVNTQSLSSLPHSAERKHHAQKPP